MSKLFTFEDIKDSGVNLGRRDLQDIVKLLRQDQVTPQTKNLRMELAEKLEKQVGRATTP